MNPTHEALTHASRALRDATWAFELEMAKCDPKDLPASAIEAITNAPAALWEALAEVESYRPAGGSS